MYFLSPFISKSRQPVQNIHTTNTNLQEKKKKDVGSSISSSMRQVLFKCEMPQLELESSATFLAIKRCQRKKLEKLLSNHEALFKKWAHICARLT